MIFPGITDTQEEQEWSTFISQRQAGSLDDGMNITDVWCDSNNLPDSVIESVYNCFWKSRGTKNFLIEIKCENEVFPPVCENEPESSSRLSSCYQREGLVIQDEESLLEDEKHLKNLVSLINHGRRLLETDLEEE